MESKMKSFFILQNKTTICSLLHFNFTQHIISVNKKVPFSWLEHLNGTPRLYMLFYLNVVFMATVYAPYVMLPFASFL